MARRHRNRARSSFRALLGFAAWGAIGAGAALVWFKVGWSEAAGISDDVSPGVVLLAAGAIVLLYLLLTHRRPTSSSGGGARRLAIDHEAAGGELAPCPDCGKSIDVRRPQCIHCGAVVG
ncbi:MAG: hypothetical protein QNJ88_17280 [Acidimicrobiia bacterium]|nr:hypothetical protein [Acidimicrobiia bacterium]